MTDPSQPASSPPPLPSGPPTDDLPVYGAAPPVPELPAPAPVRGRALVGLAGVAIMVTGAVFAFFSLTGGDGAGSPEEAVDGLFAALSQEDAIGVLESMPPTERRILREPLEDIVSELQRLGVLSDFDLDSVPGADIEAYDLEYRSTPLTDSIVRVEIVGGTITGRTMPDDYPIGDSLRKVFEGDDESFESDEATTDFADESFTLVAVDEGGGWHVSLGYSIAEWARGESDLTSGTLGGGPVPEGAPSPEDAVRELLDAAVALDPERAVTLLAPDEMAALYDYAPAFLPEAIRSAEEMGDDDFELSIDELELEAEGSGTTRRVRVTNIDITWSSSYETVRWYYDGDCFGVETEYRDVPYDGYRYSYEEDGYRYGYESNQYDYYGYGGLDDYGSDDPFEFCRSDSVGEVDDEDAWLAGTGWAFLGSHHPAATVAEIDGRWYVSPVRSVLDSALEVLRAAEREDVEAFLDSWFGGWDEAGFEEVGRALPYDDYDDPYGGYYDDEHFDDEAPGISDDYPGSFDGDPLTSCWNVLEGELLSGVPPQRSLWLSQAAFAACAQDLVARGEIGESDLPPLGYFNDACWAPYEQLPPDAPEELWAAADAQVEQCSFGGGVGSRPPG